MLAAVVRDDPDWTRLPADTPAAIRRLLRRSLSKDRQQRLADMADVHLELDDATADGTSVRTVSCRSHVPSRFGSDR